MLKYSLSNIIISLFLGMAIYISNSNGSNLKPVELSESDFFDRNFRVLHLDIKGKSSLEDALNTLELFEKAIQLETRNKFLSLVEHFDLLTSNFYGNGLALLLSCSKDGHFPLYRISELRSALKQSLVKLTNLNLKNMKLSQTCLQVLLPTHDIKVPFVCTPNDSENEVDMEQLITYFEDQKYEELKYKNRYLKKGEFFLKDEMIEAEILTSFQGQILNKCEIWSIGDNSKSNSSAYFIADRLRIDVIKKIITAETYTALAKEITRDFRIEIASSKTMPWFYYYVKNCNHTTVDLVQDNFPKMEGRDLYSLRNIIIHNNAIKNIILKKGENVSIDELCKVLSIWERTVYAFSYQEFVEAVNIFKRCGFENLARKLFKSTECAISNCLMLTYLHDDASILAMVPTDVINIICKYHWCASGMI